MIGSCAFGLDCNSLDDPQTEFRVMGEKCFTKSKIFDLEVSFMANFRSLARTLHMKLIPADISNFYTRVVRDTIEYREKHPELVRNDFMNLLIQMKNFGIMDNKEDSDEQVYNGKLTFEEIAAQAFIFFLGGFETSSTTMTFSLYELSLHQDVQEKARKHIISILKKHGGKFTYEAALEMTYIEQFINGEILRQNHIRIIISTYRGTEKIPNAIKHQPSG